MLNFTQDSSESVIINGKTFNITLNSISPTSVDVTVNGHSYSLSVEKPVSLAGTGNYSVNLGSISYLPIIDTAVVEIYSPNQQTNQANSTVANATNVTINVTNNTSNTTLPNPQTAIANNTATPVANVTKAITKPVTTTTPPPASTTEFGAGIILVMALVISSMYVLTKRSRKSNGKKHFKKRFHKSKHL